jgi:hypothetical protein
VENKGRRDIVGLDKAAARDHLVAVAGAVVDADADAVAVAGAGNCRTLGSKETTSTLRLARTKGELRTQNWQLG